METQLLEDLGKISIDENDVHLEKSLEKFLDASSDNQSSSSVDLKDKFIDILMKRNTPKIVLLVVKCIAEITKNADQRMKFSNSDILEKLMEMLDTALNKRDIELTSQLCRALGNIFYSNDDSRNIIFHHDGGQILTKLFDVNNNEIKSPEELQTFSKVRSGVMSNYLLGNEELSQRAIELKIVEKIKSRIDDALHPFNDSILEHLLPLLSILTEQVSDLIFDSDILARIVKIFKSSMNSDVVESCLELFHCQAENDEIKLLLAKEGICEHIFESLEKYKSLIGNVEARSLVKLSCDLIVMILTGDEAMRYLDQTPLLSLIQKWLDSPDEYLMTTSVLALGNFARTDNHCIKMVDDKIMLKLMDILKKNIQPDADARLQHALLSAIRNLVIPKQNKDAIIDSGLVEIITPMLDFQQQPPVVFKVIGTLRMLIDGQDALALKMLNNSELIGKLVEWARKTPDMVGVNSEASRLMAWLIKNGYRSRDKGIDSEPLKAFINVDGSVDVLVKMLSSAHVVMQNEAVIALTIIALLIQNHQGLTKLLTDANIAGSLADFIGRISETERITNEILDNLSTLIIVLKKSDEMRKYLNDKQIDEKSIPRMRELATL
ncbi:hypothetical protein PVAND_007911 [Polypedilum vanderplanki]|uniref:Uncharacterized protein n=1 Tax=Polypedilum vanderplanki TaxID=319348 RepID=A0A9J6C8V8_POLVA|nr:hypothetical protein PVAND_007911 [Polypedilum vanderplanki]